MAKMKKCRLCQLEKPASEFYRRSGRPNVTRNECKICWSAQGAKWTRQNPKRCAYLHKMKNIENKTGLDRVQYATKMAAQNFKCSVCNIPFVGTRGSKSPCVDHNHTTKQVRDILCLGCNAALGSAKEDPKILVSLAAYVTRWAAA